MPVLKIDRISKSFGTVVAVHKASITIEHGELVCLLGPSGSGKSTLLRLIAGLDDPDSGSVTFDDNKLDGITPQERGFGLMFQDLALFPHMDVFGNISFGLRMKKTPSESINRRVTELLELVGLKAFAKRRIHELSGGERQRVALARALAPSPKLLMLDEPLGALDRRLRESLQVQIRSILKEVDVMAIYVTHNRDEAFAISDRLAFMENGTIVQTDTPEEIFSNPASETVARSLGFNNLFVGTINRIYPCLVEIDSEIGPILAARSEFLSLMKGERVMFFIEERAVQLTKDNSNSNQNKFFGRITERVFRGSEYDLAIDLGAKKMFFKYSSCTREARTLNCGEHAHISFDTFAVKLIPSI